MLDTHRFLLFLVAALILAATPGPGIFYVLARTLAGGRREGFQSSLGTLFGGLFHVFAAAIGVSSILAASAVAFRSVKYAGAAYLIFLGIKMIRSRNIELPQVKSSSADFSPSSRVFGEMNPVCAPVSTGAVHPPASGASRPAANAAFRQGILTEALNPKTALFFLSFIPQFIALERGHVFLQFAALGIVSVSLNTAADLVVVVLATRALRGAAGLQRKLKFQLPFRRHQPELTLTPASAARTASGLGMISLGAYLALSDSN